MSLVVLLASLSAHAGTWSAEDLVTAHARGLPTETVARMAESVGLDDATTVYLLRRGVPGEAIAAWGRPVSEAEGIAALRLGAIDAPPPVVADVARVDAAVLDRAIEARVEDTEGIELPLEGRRRVLVRRGNTQLATGALLSVGGGVLFAMGTRGPVAPFDRLYDGPTRVVPATDAPLVAASLCSWGCSDAADVGVLEPDPVVMGLGALLMLGGGVTLHFGAEKLRLAGPLVDPWTDAE